MKIEMMTTLRQDFSIISLDTTCGKISSIIFMVTVLN
jgi:hypothetical protein